MSNVKHVISPLFALIFLMGCSKGKSGPDILCFPATSSDCPLQLFTSIDAEETIYIAGKGPFDFNRHTGYGMIISPNFSLVNDTFSLTQTIQIIDSNSQFFGIPNAQIIISDFKVPANQTDEEYLNTIKNADWEISNYFDFYKPFQIHIQQDFIESLPKSEDPSSQFIIDDAQIFHQNGATYVRFLASFSCTMRSFENGPNQALNAGRCVGLIQKPILFVQP